MLLDKCLIKNLHLLGSGIMEKAGLNKPPENLEELFDFFKTLQSEAEEKNDASANMIYNILYNFVSSAEVRDRHTSPREFEDIFCSLFGTECADDGVRVNPPVTEVIKKYDEFTNDLGWTISSDFSINKREKADVSIGEYKISLKTLKGKQYDENYGVLNTSCNNEINIGGFSYRALFKGILTDRELAHLSDRKKGLGSKVQIRRNVLNPILTHGKKDDFSKRLKDSFSYVYEEDLVIVIKSDYKMDIYFIPNKTFVDVVCKLYDEKECEFENLWYRWENNNLRFSLPELLRYIEFFNFEYKKSELKLASFKTQEEISKFNQKLNEMIENELEKIINPASNDVIP